MIKIDKSTPLTGKSLSSWYKEWAADRERLDESWRLFTNKKGNSNYLKLPFVKKLVTISAAATAGDGITLSLPEDMGEAEKKTFEEIQKLFKKQIIGSQDYEVIKQGCTFGRGYELAYMSEDEVPVPKTSRISATNAFVVFDDTVEHNGLYGVYFEEFKEGSADKIRLFVYDSENKYTVTFDKAAFIGIGVEDINISKESPEAHHMGRMPLTEYKNNDEEQSDFEQVIDLIKDRSAIHNLNLKDMKDIAKNYLKGRNIKFAGKTAEEKAESRKKAAEQQLIEFEAEDATDDVSILSKSENYSSIDVFGRDTDNKIYDLTMIPDLSDDKFAGNQSGVALDFKLRPFKELVKAKDVYIERLYRRRLKMYMHALTVDSKKFTKFDAGDIEITINRTWTENLQELAATVNQLAATGLFSDEFLINTIPKADYDIEKDRKANEAEEKRQESINNPDANNSSLGQFNAELRRLGISNGS